MLSTPFRQQGFGGPEAARAVAVEGAQVHPPDLVEAKRPGVVVGRYELEASVHGRRGAVSDGVHQGAADPHPNADYCNHFALPAGHVVDREADGPSAGDGDEAGQNGGVDQDPLRATVTSPNASRSRRDTQCRSPRSTGRMRNMARMVAHRHTTHYRPPVARGHARP
jgi:hypothetical protein